MFVHQRLFGFHFFSRELKLWPPTAPPSNISAFTGSTQKKLSYDSNHSNFFLQMEHFDGLCSVNLQRARHIWINVDLRLYRKMRPACQECHTIECKYPETLWSGRFSAIWISMAPKSATGRSRFIYSGSLRQAPIKVMVIYPSPDIYCRKPSSLLKVFFFFPVLKLHHYKFNNKKKRNSKRGEVPAKLAWTNNIKQAEGIKQSFAHRVRNNQHKPLEDVTFGHEWRNEIMYNNPITHVCHLTSLKSTDIWTRIIHVAQVRPIYSCTDCDSRLRKSALASRRSLIFCFVFFSVTHTHIQTHAHTLPARTLANYAISVCSSKTLC